LYWGLQSTHIFFVIKKELFSDFWAQIEVVKVAINYCPTSILSGNEMLIRKPKHEKEPTSEPLSSLGLTLKH
jgi:hypothetical protein